MQFSTYQAVPPLTQEQEMELAPLARAGDPAAQDAMLRSVIPLVRSLAVRACRAGVEVDDLQQAGMVSCWRALRSYDPTRGRWCAWAGRHARFDILHAAQDGAPTGSPLIDAPAPPQGVEEAEEARDREQSGAAVRAALRHTLGPRDAEILSLRILEDYSVTQTAKRLHLSWRTINAVEAAGLAKLRATMSRATA